MGALAAGVMMTACSPEKFDGADPNGIPSVSGVDIPHLDYQRQHLLYTAGGGIPES